MVKVKFVMLVSCVKKIHHIHANQVSNNNNYCKDNLVCVVSLLF